MKNLIVSVLALLYSINIAYSASMQLFVYDSSFDCNAVQSSDCPSATGCLYRNPNNCSQYYQCSNGRAYLHECAHHEPPLYFDPNKNRCDFQSADNQCRESSETTTEESSTTEEVDVTTTDPPSNNDPAATTTQPPTTAGSSSTTTQTSTTAGSSPTTADPPAETTTEPPTTAGSSSTTTEEPAQTTTEAVETTTEPVQTTTEAAQTTTAPPAATTVCGSPQAQSNITAGCPGPRNCRFPNPNNCHTFIQCVPASGNCSSSVDYVFPCAYENGTQLYWNDDTLSCDENSTETCPVPTTTEQPETTTEEPTTEPSTDETTTEEGTEDPSDSTTADPPADPVDPPADPPSSGTGCESTEAKGNLTAGCPAPRNCMFPNPYNCQSFLQCQPGPDGKPIEYVMPCAYGFDGQLYWNDKTLTCETKSNSTCPDNQTGNIKLYRIN